ncbi:hypothetical protein [Mesorhizobium sp. M1B.F.Ca.ET.045.04.1.1]|uniref:hypothetical protein n=1 Tax=Mesorhizobium sp. M1B.F.Ca.ET.045.04.1.1 TaxID=2493673 RepID=UPI00167C34F9|nr:hypothetical protein [Mesorhizobium sp. M1B.F.Ca.ET.045.04.1.1]
MIRDQYRQTEKPESKKGLKPKPVTRPKGKEVDRVVRDMQPAGRGPGYKTR